MFHPVVPSQTVPQGSAFVYKAPNKAGQILAGAAVTSLAIWFGIRTYRKVVSNKVEKETFVENSPAFHAKALKMAFENDGWWGTNNDEVRKTILAIPSKEHFQQVQEKYYQLYAPNVLMRDLKSELKSTEFDEMIAIISTKPNKGSTKLAVVATPAQYEKWAERLKAAFDIQYGIFPGTDEGAIKAVFSELTSKAQFETLKDVYFQKYRTALLDDLNSELEFWEKDKIMGFLPSK